MDLTITTPEHHQVIGMCHAAKAQEARSRARFLTGLKPDCAAMALRAAAEHALLARQGVVEEENAPALARTFDQMMVG